MAGKPKPQSPSEATGTEAHAAPEWQDSLVHFGGAHLDAPGSILARVNEKMRVALQKAGLPEDYVAFRPLPPTCWRDGLPPEIVHNCETKGTIGHILLNAWQEDEDARVLPFAQNVRLLGSLVAIHLGDPTRKVLLLCERVAAYTGETLETPQPRKGSSFRAFAGYWKETITFGDAFEAWRNGPQPAIVTFQTFLLRYRDEPFQSDTWETFVSDRSGAGWEKAPTIESAPRTTSPKRGRPKGTAGKWTKRMRSKGKTLYAEGFNDDEIAQELTALAREKTPDAEPFSTGGVEAMRGRGRWKRAASG